MQMGFTRSQLDRAMMMMSNDGGDSKGSALSMEELLMILTSETGRLMIG